MNERWQGGRIENNRIDDRILIYALAKKSKNPTEFLSDIGTFSRQSSITPNQLRNLYDIVVEIKPKNMDEAKQKLAKLRIMLEYAWNRRTIKRDFYFPVKAMIDALLDTADEKKLEDFKEMMEAIVAYSKKEK